MRSIALSLLVLALLVACATVPPSTDAARVEALVRFIETEPVDAVVEQSGLPFLFESQILYSAADLSAVLTRLQSGGLILDPESVRIGAFPAFGADLRFDQKVYADDLPEDAREVLVSSTLGQIILYVGGSRDGMPLLLGLKRGDL